MKKRLLTLPLITLLLGGIKAPTLHPTKVNAATPMPTSIIFENNSDNEVSDYYAGVEGKKGDELLSFLYSVIKDHNEYDYESNIHRNIYKIIDRNWELDAIDTVSPANLDNFDYVNDNGFIHKLYADYNNDINTADRFKNEGASRVSFDKEHIWAQSLGNFGRTGGAGSDFHSLWPSDVRGNQQAHSNYNYAVPTSSIKEITNDYGTLVGRNGYISGSDQKVFEPLDEYKGDIARAMFYMPARYYEYVDELHPKLELVNGSPAARKASTTVTGQAGSLETLLQWHEQDPVSDYEIRRNNLIANNYQGNRNPFIDYPQWARIAYDPNYTGPGASNESETSSVGSNNDGLEGAILTSITLDTTNVKKSFNLGESFSTNSLIVTAHYDNNESRKVSNYTSSIAIGSTLDSEGTHTVTISYTYEGVTKTATYEIVVQELILGNYLFISEAYGGGGNSGAEYKSDFIELYNYANFPLSLDGYSVQYASASAANWSVTPLSGNIAPKSYYLIKQANGKGGIISLPLPESVGASDMAATGFKIALVSSIDELTVSDPTEDSRVIDFVGAGGANAFYGTGPAPAPSNKQSIQRKFITEGTTPPPTSDNSLDHEKGNPTPSNAALTIAMDIIDEGNTQGQCLALYEPYKARVLELSSAQLNYFKTVTTEDEDRLVKGRARYEAWARHLGDDKPYEYNENFERGPSNNTGVEKLIMLLVLFIGAVTIAIVLYVVKSRSNPAKMH